MIKMHKICELIVIQRCNDCVQISFNRSISILFGWLYVPCFPIRLNFSLLPLNSYRTFSAHINPTDRVVRQPMSGNKNINTDFSHK